MDTDLGLSIRIKPCNSHSLVEMPLFQLSRGLILCVCVSADINECSSLSEPCSSGFNCINTVGSFTCQKKVIMCSHGYQASPDGAKCVGEILPLEHGQSRRDTMEIFE